MNHRFRVISDKDGIRLDVFLADRLSLTRMKVQAMIEGGHVRIGGKSTKPSMKIKRGMEIEGEIPEEEPLTLTAQAIPLDILYEDEYMLAVNKPPDMVVHPSCGHKEGTLVNAVLGYLNRKVEVVSREEVDTRYSELRVANPEPGYASMRPGIVHRLDKGTTGVIIIAKDAKTQEMLSGLFKERSVRKIYRAIVEGVPKEDEWTIDANIGRHPVERKKMAVLKEKGRSAFTGFRMLERFDRFAYVEAYPKTGRTHQIRVHLACSGHPVVGDDLYGRQAKRFAERPLLHAHRIEFIHPIRNVPVLVEAPVPEDMVEFITKIRGNRDKQVKVKHKRQG